MHDLEFTPGSDGARRADHLLFLAMAILAGLLACYDLFDPDIWWHLRAGRWILENRQVPRLDPFSFASADRPWIDLHWGFQVALATAHAVGGVPGLIILAALAAASSVAIATSARRREWPAWVVALCWLPALALMATRFDPRPEAFSLVYLASVLAILSRVDRRPALAWLLVPVQWLWVNSHSLFILGPIVLGCYWVDRIARAYRDGRRAAHPGDASGSRVGRHLFAASAAVLLATLANPYGVRGVLLPMELLPKISDPNNPYKGYVDEFASVRSVVRDQMAGVPGPRFHLRVQVFLLLLIAWSFLLPALRRSGGTASDRRDGDRASRSPFAIIGPVVILGLAIVAAMGLPLPGTASWLSRAAAAVPAVLLIGGSILAVLVASRAGLTAAALAVGTAAAAAWAVWLRAYLLGDGWGPAGLPAWAIACAGAGLGAVAAFALFRAGASPFGMLLAVAFSYLSLQAVRNINLFGLVGGTVLAGNVGEWAASLAPARPHRRSARAARVAILAVLGAWSAGVVTNRYYDLVGEAVRFGLHEQPAMFAHRAAAFAGRPGLPGRALAFDLGQSGVYVYHNAPERKVFMDGRLEVPSLATFREYVRIEDRLNRNDPRWEAEVRRLGDPLILIGHEGWIEGEATLLAHPQWRCVYFDEVASVFVARGGPSSAPGVPDFDFAAGPPAGTASPTLPGERDRQRREAGVLFRLGSALQKRGGDPWRARIPVLIGAARRIRTLLAVEPASAADWRLLGLIEWQMVPDLRRPPQGPDDPWDPAAGLPWARATHGFRRALGASPGDVPTRKALADCFGVRGMSKARRSVEAISSGVGPAEAVRSLASPLGSAAGRPWPEADRIATTALHLGDPDAARRAWADAADAPSLALRLARMAGADLAAFDAGAAESRCRQALALDPRLGEARYVRAAALIQSGRLDEALAECRAGLGCDLTPAQRDSLVGLEALLDRRRSGAGSR